MEQPIYCHNQLPELLEAFSNGFQESFIITAAGLLLCLANPDKLYDLDEIDIGPPVSLSIPATLFLITTKDGWRGTLIDWHY